MRYCVHCGSVSGAYAAYQLGRFEVYSEWKLWLEEVYKKQGDKEAER